jgi:lipoprotein-anchoring transpeptidase ErfK/SrfK
MKTKVLAVMTIIILPLIADSGIAGAMEERLYQELIQSGRVSNSSISEMYGVPGLKVSLRKGESISNFCRTIPSLSRNAETARKKIAFLNRMNYSVSGSFVPNKKEIFIPLDYNIKPRILPAYIKKISKYKKFIYIDIGKGYLGLYRNGSLVDTFAIGSGRTGTPARSFKVLGKQKDHYSKKYENAWMPYSLHLFDGFYLHGSLLIGYDISKGCINVNTEDIQKIYNFADVGTPGLIVRKGKM